MEESVSGLVCLFLVNFQGSILINVLEFYLKSALSEILKTAFIDVHFYVTFKLCYQKQYKLCKMVRDYYKYNSRDGVFGIVSGKDIISEGL